jgi:hypothetical protein
MSPLDMDTALGWRGRTVVDRDGEKVGTLDDLYLEGESDLPAWGGVRTGLFGSRESLVPLDRVEEDGDDLRLPFLKQEVVDAPRVDPDVALEPEEEDALRRHYGRADGARDDAAPQEAPQGGGAVAVGDAATAGRDAAAEGDERRRDARQGGAAVGTGDAAAEGDERREDAPQAGAPARAGEAAAEPGELRRERGEGGPEMIRSEEELKTGTTPMQPRERVRIRKVTVTDHVKRTVPVRREEVRLETDPPESGRVESSEDVP